MSCDLHQCNVLTDIFSLLLYGLGRNIEVTDREVCRSGSSLPEALVVSMLHWSLGIWAACIDKGTDYGPFIIPWLIVVIYMSMGNIDILLTLLGIYAIKANMYLGSVDFKRYPSTTGPQQWGQANKDSILKMGKELWYFIKTECLIRNTIFLIWVYFLVASLHAWYH